MRIHAFTHIYNIYEEKKPELDSHLEQIADGDAQRNDKTREIDLTEDVLVGSEGAATLVETVCEIVPTKQTRHIKQGLRKAIGRDTSNASKHDHEHDGGDERLYDKPQGAKDGLLIERHNVTLDVHADEITITPKLPEVYVPETCFCFDNLFLSHFLFSEE